MTEASPGEIIGRNVRAVREAKLFSRGDLAKRAGVSLAGIDNLERGLSARPRRRTIEKLARGLEVDVDTLMGEAAHPLGEALPWQERLFNGARERDAFIERVKIYISSRAAHYEKRLAEAEQGGVLAGYEGARLLFDDALDEFMVLPVFINGELAERWMLDPDIPENIKVDLGFAVGEALRPLVEVVGRIGEREKELAETEVQQAEAQQRREQMVLQTQRISERISA
jgi:transcriptional regulator with XRE-family HTH domain